MIAKRIQIFQSLKKGLTILNEYDIKILYKNVRDYILYIYTFNISSFGCLLHYCGCKKYQYVSHRYETTHIGGYPFYPDKLNLSTKRYFYS